MKLPFINEGIFEPHNIYYGYTLFNLISYIYIYTHPKKKSLVFSIKIMFVSNCILKCVK